MIGIDPSMTLCYRDEYVSVTDNKQTKFKVQLLQEWLSTELPKLGHYQVNSVDKNYLLFCHCSEKSLYPQSEKNWQAIFAHFGIKIGVASASCCGMAGVYGHESNHLLDSKKLYKMSWQGIMDGNSKDSVKMVTGYSCRTQVKRETRDADVSHPAQMLLEILSSSSKAAVTASM